MKQTPAAGMTALCTAQSAHLEALLSVASMPSLYSSSSFFLLICLTCRHT